MKPKSMKTILLAALLAPGALFAQTTATTTPVGYVSLGDTTTGQPAVKANTDVWISIPLLRSATTTATVASVSGNTITFSGSPNLGTLTSPPHIAVVGSGPGTADGLLGTITASSSTEITIATPDESALTGIVAGDTISIRPAWTVLSLMGTDMPSGTILFTYNQSSAFNPSATGIYEFDGTDWIDNVNTGEAANNDILYPYETLVVRNSSSTPIQNFVVAGEVSNQPIRLQIAEAGASGSDNAISYFSPVSEEVSASGFSTIANNGDLIFGFDNGAQGFNKSAVEIHEFSAGNWIDNVNTGEANNSYPIGAGKGFIFRRASAAPTAILSDTPAYFQSL